jgi:hypothetical protein
MRLLISNAFALSMLDRDEQCGNGQRPPRTPRPCPDPRDFLNDATARGVEVESIVGHADTAAIFSTILNHPVAHNRATIKLGPGDLLLVGQYVGPRLPEGATELPEGATIEWWTI